MDLGIPTRSVALRIWTVDGASFDAKLFLHLNAENHDGPETVQDRLNDPNLFVYLAVAGEGPVLFLNKIQIIRVDLTDEGLPPEPAHDLSEVSIEPVRVQLINGELLTGTVRIEGPAGPAAPAAPLRLPEHPAGFPAPVRHGSTAPPAEALHRPHHPGNRVTRARSARRIEPHGQD